PLLRGGRLLGKFMLYHDEPHEWSDRELLLSRTIANHLASVTERTQAQDALRASREQLTSIVRTVEEGISATSPDGRFLFANDAAARVAGLESAEELLALAPEGRYDRYEVTDADGHPVAREELPSSRAAAGEESSAV